MVDNDFFADTTRFDDVMKRCDIPLNEEERTGFKLNLDEVHISQFGFKEDLYIMTFNPVSFKRYLRGVENEEKVSSTVRRFVSMFIETYDPNITILDVMLESNQELLLLGTVIQQKNKSTKQFRVIGGAIYKMSPFYGVFVSILHIDSNFRKQGYGKLILWLLQYFSSQLFDIMHIYVWMTRLELQEKKKKNKLSAVSQNKNGHILFYRKLGFVPSNPMNLPLEQMVPSELCRLFRDPMTSFDTKTLSTSCLEIIGE